MSWFYAQIPTVADGFSRTSHALMGKNQTTLRVEKLAQTEYALP
jgi:hypothetical protein